jgi:hypothetical protein
MTDSGLRHCRVCRAARPLDDLLLVTPTNGGPRWWVCRPARPMHGPVPPGACFRAEVPSVFLARIELAGAP